MLYDFFITKRGNLLLQKPQTGSAFVKLYCVMDAYHDVAITVSKTFQSLNVAIIYDIYRPTMNNSHTFACHYYYMMMSAGLRIKAAVLAASLLKFTVQRVQIDRKNQFHLLGNISFIAFFPYLLLKQSALKFQQIKVLSIQAYIFHIQ